MPHYISFISLRRHSPRPTLFPYTTLFRSRRHEKVVGEASAAYLWSETAAGNIASRIPEAKIIMILRDPSERAFSQYLDRKSTRLNSSHLVISYAVFCLKKKIISTFSE